MSRSQRADVMKLARMAVDRPVTMYMFYVAVILLGAVSLRELSVDLLPDISYPRLSVITNYPGVAPEEVETLITAPLESAVSRVPGLRRVESVSKEGVSLLTLEFDWGTDMDFTMLHTREQLDNAKDRFPEDAESPTIIPLDPQSRPIMTLALSGDRTLLELKELSEELIKPRLEQIEGVGSAEITGGVEREIQVEADPQKLALYGLTVEDVAARVDAFNRNLQGGTIRKGTFKYALRVVGEFESLDEIGEIGLLVTKEGGVVRLRDVATVIDSIKERQGMTRLDGAESIGLLVRKESGANTVKVTKLVRETIGQIRAENPGITLSVVNEQAKTIEDAIGAVKDELHPGRDPGLPDPAHLPPGVEDAAHHRHGHPHLDHRRVQPALLRQHHPQHHVARRPGPGGGHARRLRRRRLGEHLPPPQPREGAERSGLHRDEGGRPGGRVHGPDDDRRLPAGHLRPRRRRAAVQGHGLTYIVLHRNEGGRPGGRVHGPDDDRRLSSGHLRSRRRRAAVQGHRP